MTGWRAKANCLGINPGLFFPHRGDNDDSDAAKQVCAGCGVRTECLAAAMSTPLEQFGIWGGTSVRERSQIRATRQRRVA